MREVGAKAVHVGDETLTQSVRTRRFPRGQDAMSSSEQDHGPTEFHGCQVTPMDLSGHMDTEI